MAVITRRQSETETAQLEDGLRAAERAGDPARQVAALQAALAHPCSRHEFHLPELCYELADALRRLGRFDDAIAAIEHAIAEGHRSWPLPQADIAELHLLAGRHDQAALIYRDLAQRTPGDVWLYNSAGLAYQDTGDHDSAIGWLTRGLDLALRSGDPERVADQLTAARDHSLTAAGSEPDQLSARAAAFLTEDHKPPAGWQPPEFLGDPPPADQPCGHCGWQPQTPSTSSGPMPRQPLAEATDLSTARAGVALAWFPAAEWAKARDRWPELTELGLPADHRAYRRHMQGRLLALAAIRAPKIHVAPLTVDGLESYARNERLDPNEGDTRAGYAAELLRVGDAIAWPPGRNQPCWCGSGVKYKHCCATAPIRTD